MESGLDLTAQSSRNSSLMNSKMRRHRRGDKTMEVKP